MVMINTKLFDALNKPSEPQKDEIVDFLHTHLQQYRDPKEDIRKAINYAIKETPSFGGFTLLAYDNSDIIGAVVINKTGMKGYIPDNILVYIATHEDHRGKGVGKNLMQEAMNIAKGDIALHVEHNNPAKHLYEKLGFTNPYLEMRYRR